MKRPKSDIGDKMFQNVGARTASNLMDIRTKKALKELIATNPTNVLLYSTDAFGPESLAKWTADKLDIGTKYSVVGPNPYNSRKWYATVERTATGVKVS